MISTFVIMLSTNERTTKIELRINHLYSENNVYAVDVILMQYI